MEKVPDRYFCNGYLVLFFQIVSVECRGLKYPIMKKEDVFVRNHADPMPFQNASSHGRKARSLVFAHYEAIVETET